MKGFLLGLIVAGVGFAGYYYLKGNHLRWPVQQPVEVVDAGAAPKEAREKKKKRRRGAMRVEAPAILQKGGIYGCIKGVVGGIRFPPSNGSQIVSYPFSLT